MIDVFSRVLSLVSPLGMGLLVAQLCAPPYSGRESVHRRTAVGKNSAFGVALFSDVRVGIRVDGTISTGCFASKR